MREGWKAETARRTTLEGELTKIDRAIAQIVDATADGMYHPSMKEKMASLQSQKDALETELSTVPDETPFRLHPGSSELYRRKVAQLTQALNADEVTRAEATETLRGLIASIRITPQEDAEPKIELVGELAAIMALSDKKISPAVEAGLIRRQWLRGEDLNL